MPAASKTREHWLRPTAPSSGTLVMAAVVSSTMVRPPLPTRSSLGTTRPLGRARISTEPSPPTKETTSSAIRTEAPVSRARTTCSTSRHAYPSGILRRAHPDFRPLARQPGHRRRQYRPYPGRDYHRPARTAPSRKRLGGHRSLRVARLHHHRRERQRGNDRRRRGVRRSPGRRRDQPGRLACRWGRGDLYRTVKRHFGHLPRRHGPGHYQWGRTGQH